MTTPVSAPPNFLRDHAEAYTADPRAACAKWFREARYGLFLHYGLYSLLGRHEWVQLREKIRPGDYAELAHAFIADRFDADAIVDFAIECGMRYVNLTTRHHDGFCLWPSKQTPFNSVQAAPCGRNLVRELSEACDRKGIGLCLYYSHGRDWKHPHAPNNEGFAGAARPEYDPPEPTYASGAAHDLNLYVRFMAEQVRELLTDHGPIAAIWLDGIGVPKNPKDENGEVRKGYDPARDGDPFRCQELYDLVHSLQPHTLVSYKQGYLGTEDFFAPEHKVGQGLNETAAGRPIEVCTTAGGGWGYTAGTPYLTADELWQTLQTTLGGGANLLMNVGPLPDGSLPQDAQDTLKTVGRWLKERGYPAPA